MENPVKGTIEALYKPVEDIVKTLAGPAAEEIGLSFRDSVQAWRLKRQIRLFGQVKKVCAKSGIKPQAVKLPLLFDVLNSATLEEDDDLQDLWANLLASAADPKRNALVLAAFPDILRQISKEEALYLEDMYLRSERSLAAEQFAKTMPERLKTKPATVAPVYADNIRRLGLIEEKDKSSRYRMSASSILSDPPKWFKEPREWELTELGIAFIRACHGPAPKKPE